jgi:competence protein ComEC
MLIDGGGTHATDEAHGAAASESAIGEKIVAPMLRRLGVSEINILLITHPHGDHVGGLAAVVRDFKVDAVLDGTTLPYPSQTYHDLIAQIQAKLIPYEPARRGETLSFGDGVTGTVLSPPIGRLLYGTGFDDKTINDYSAVVRLAYGHNVLLLDGDAEAEAEQDILATYPLSYLKADVLKAGHHGSRNASSDAWLDAVQPKIAIICCGKNNLFMHPHPETLARLAAHHVLVYRTDLDGNIEVDCDGSRVTARAGI